MKMSLRKVDCRDMPEPVPCIGPLFRQLHSTGQVCSASRKEHDHAVARILPYVKQYDTVYCLIGIQPVNSFRSEIACNLIQHTRNQRTGSRRRQLKRPITSGAMNDILSMSAQYLALFSGRYKERQHQVGRDKNGDKPERIATARKETAALQQDAVIGQSDELPV